MSNYNLIVCKSNKLNEVNLLELEKKTAEIIRGMNYTEVLMLCVYLAKIDTNNSNSKVVTMHSSELNNILKNSKYTENTNYITRHRKDFEIAMRGLLNILIVEDTSTTTRMFHLFSWCEIIDDNTGGFTFHLESNEKASKYIFNFKNQFFKYNLSNITSLKSSTQIRMYEILKQYEYAGSRVLTLEQLKELLGLEKTAYQGRWGNFKTRVLDSCQKALAENTDISFTYEPYKKQGRKIIALKFYIHSNESKIDTKQISIDSIPPTEYSSYLDEFTQPQITELLSIIEQNMTVFEKIEGVLPEVILNKEYIKFNSQVSTINNINNRFSYFRQILKNK